MKEISSSGSNRLDGQKINESAYQEFKGYLNGVEAKNDKRLSNNLTLLRYALAMLNLYLARKREPLPSPCVDTDTIFRANHYFQQLFPNSVTSMLEEVLRDPGAYREKIDKYENEYAQRPDLPFDTKNENYRLIVRDPLRIKEEHFLYSALLENDHLSADKFRGVDLGTGSGRLAFCMLEILHKLRSEGYKIYGLDINPENIDDARNIQKSKNYQNMEFVQGDMLRTQFDSNQFSLANVSTASYFTPLYERPFMLLEMCRILHKGGEGIITGPNEKSSLASYAKCIMTSNLRTFINPVNIRLARKMSPTALLLIQMFERRDFSFSNPQDLYSALKYLGCEIKKVQNWPQNNSIEDFYTGIHFRVTAETKKILEKHPQLC